MKNLKYLVCILFLLSPRFSNAEVYINEIMYDVSGTDSGREWVEINNTGSDIVDISKWKFLESPTASNHSLTQIQGTSEISPGGFAVIVSDPTKFLSDWPTFSGNLFKASFSSLNNTGGVVSIKDDSSVVQDQVTYNSTQGSNGDGNSLQKSGLVWISGIPTPGFANTNESIIVDSSNASTTDSNTQSQSVTIGSGGSSSNTSAHSSPVPLSSTDQKMEFEISAGRDRLTSVGSNVLFSAEPTVIKNISDKNISYFWSFGDGVTAQGNNVSHVYKFAGEYSVVVNASFSDIQAVSRIIVKVIEPRILLNRVSGGIEIINNSGSEINLEGWNLIGQAKTFIFPKDTLIPSGKKVIFPDEVTGINSGDVIIKNLIGRKYAEIIDNLNVSTSTTVQIDTDSIKEKVKDITEKVAVLSSQINDIPVSGVAVSPEGLSSDNSKIFITKKPVAEIKASEMKNENNDQTANVVTLFEAPQSKGFVETLFAWPIKGFNLIRDLFTEK